MCSPRSQRCKILPRFARPSLRKGAFRSPPLEKEGQGGFRQQDQTSMTHTATDTAVIPAASGHLPVVAIVGRPNAGKSTLFNRLIRQRKAVVDDTPGVTRDRNFAPAKWRNTPFVLVDTGGIDVSESAG